VRYIEAEANHNVTLDASGGVEVLILSGTINESGDDLRKGSWLRSPAGSQITAKAGPEGAKIWVKSGHLSYAKAPAV
jgi:hypothetical protein